MSKITRFHAENVKVLKAVTITPEGNVVTLTGPNGAGKSTILDAVEMTIAGADKIGKRPIRDGSSSAKSVITLDNGLVITRTFGASGTSLKVADAEGKPQRSPQAILDALVGSLAFDPFAFTRLKPDAQLATLRRLVGLDTSALDSQRATLYNNRTLVNREHDSAKARLALFPFDDKAPAEEVNVSALTGQLDAINKEYARKKDVLEQDLRKLSDDHQAAVDVVNKFNNDARQHNANVSQAVANKQAREKRIAELEAQLKAERDALAKIVIPETIEVKPLPTAPDRTPIQQAILALQPDTSAITEQINNAAKVNEAVQKNRQHNEQAKLVADKLAESQKLTAEIEKVDAAKAKMLADCKFPLEGLSIDGSEILFNKLPFEQASTAEKLRVSVAIGMALNPNLRVIFVRDGSLLDPSGLKAIADMAEKNGFQIWLEDARSTDPTAVVIEDGMVKAKEPHE